ncbi:MAG TPA: YidB family protein, partial [Candidatus Deferrimicrobiaceae bacterium]
TLKDRGLGDIVSSWVGTGQNLPISAEQLQGGLGANLIGQLAAKAGISGEEASAKLAELLPSLVDKLTPDGQLPESGLLQQGLDMLRNNLPKG